MSSSFDPTSRTHTVMRVNRAGKIRVSRVWTLRSLYIGTRWRSSRYWPTERDKPARPRNRYTASKCVATTSYVSINVPAVSRGWVYINSPSENSIEQPILFDALHRTCSYRSSEIAFREPLPLIYRADPWQIFSRKLADVKVGGIDNSQFSGEGDSDWDSFSVGQFSVV